MCVFRSLLLIGDTFVVTVPTSILLHKARVSPPIRGQPPKIENIALERGRAICFPDARSGLKI